MTPADASHLLTLAAFYDGRTIGESAARAWAEALADTDPTDARAAVINHYGETTRWLMPADIRVRVRVMRDDRIQRTPIDSPGDPDDERAYRAAMARGIKAIADRRALDHAIGSSSTSGHPSEEYRVARAEAGHDEVRGAALRVTCPWCHAHPGEGCAVPLVGTALTGSPAHRGRLEAAEVSQKAEIHDTEEPA